MRNWKRFLNEPKELTPETMVLGFTAAQWHEALTGNIEGELLDAKRRVDECAANVRKIPPEMTSTDVASSYASMKTNSFSIDRDK